MCQALSSLLASLFGIRVLEHTDEFWQQAEKRMCAARGHKQRAKYTADGQMQDRFKYRALEKSNECATFNEEAQRAQYESDWVVCRTRVTRDPPQ